MILIFLSPYLEKLSSKHVAQWLRLSFPCWRNTICRFRLFRFFRGANPANNLARSSFIPDSSPENTGARVVFIFFFHIRIAVAAARLQPMRWLQMSSCCFPIVIKFTKVTDLVECYPIIRWPIPQGLKAKWNNNAHIPSFTRCRLSVFQIAQPRSDVALRCWNLNN